jgi:hypothetical protein
MSRESFCCQFERYPGCPEEEFPICLIAVLDCISNRAVSKLSYAMYKFEYEQKRHRFPKGVPTKQNNELMKKHLLRADDNNCDYIHFLAFNEQEAFDTQLAISRLRRDRIIIYVDDGHVVGLVPKDNGLWQMVGHNVPTKELLTHEQIWEQLFVATGENKDNPNMIILGPEKLDPNDTIPASQLGDNQWIQEAAGILGFARSLRRVVTGW